MQNLSPRQESILTRVVDAYIETGQPVGSGSITELYRKLYQGSYSSATVRHEMGRLETMGYLTHPHTSAGRIPTDYGYRYYVDHGLPCDQEVALDIEDTTLEDSREEGLELFAERALSALSEQTHEVCLVLVPRAPKRFLKGQMRPFQLLMQGSSSIVEKPEFQDWQKVQSILKAFEETSEMMQWLRSRDSHEEVSITIGRENDQEAFQDCAVVSKHYFYQGENLGTLAVVGSRRMQYARILSLVEQMGKVLGRAVGESQASTQL